MPPGTPLLQVRDVRKTYRLRPTLADRLRGRRSVVTAVGGVSITVSAGEILGVVGESGSGKSTLGKIIVRLVQPTSGSVIFAASTYRRREGGALLPYRRRVQMIFQDTHSSLNPRKRVGTMLDRGAGGVRHGARPANRRG